MISVGEDYRKGLTEPKLALLVVHLFHHSALVQNITELGDTVEEQSIDPNNREDGIRWLLFTRQGDQNSYRMEYIQLDVDITMLMGTLGVGTLGMGGCRARYARGIGGSKEWMGSAVGSSENMLFEVCRALYPTNLLHVGRPSVLATPCGLDSKREERNGVSENCKASGECDRRNQINCETYA